MSGMSSDRLLDVANDIDLELARLERLANEILLVKAEADRQPDLARWLNESIALKLHNFYTGCERIFQIIATELNGGLPAGGDWHVRLIERMASARDRRIAVIAPETARALQLLLGFRHVVRNVYGFELDPARLTRLVEGLPETHSAMRRDLLRFTAWLRQLASVE